MRIYCFGINLIFVTVFIFASGIGVDNLNIVRSIGRLLDHSSHLISSVQHMILAQGADTVRITKVVGHATDDDVEGRARAEEREAMTRVHNNETDTVINVFEQELMFPEFERVAREVEKIVAHEQRQFKKNEQGVGGVFAEASISCGETSISRASISHGNAIPLYSTRHAH